MQVSQNDWQTPCEYCHQADGNLLLLDRFRLQKINPASDPCRVKKIYHSRQDSNNKNKPLKKGKDLPETPAEPGQQVMCKTVVELDLVAYSDIARLLEQAIGAIGVRLLEQQVQKLVDCGLQAVGLSRAETFLQTSGDNAVLAFDRAEDAHYFAQTIHKVSQAENQKKSLIMARQQYRIGIATGELVMFDDHLGSASGIVITDAVRLEAAAAPGEIVIDKTTYQALPTELQCQYSAEECITGKRAEVFEGYRCSLSAPVSQAEITSFSGRSLFLYILDFIFGTSHSLDRQISTKTAD